MRAIPPETREELEKLEQKHAENPEGRYFVPLANALRKAGELPRAAELLREGIGRHPEYVSAHIVLGRCLQDYGSLAEAEWRFRHVLSLDGQNLVALRALGDLAAAAGQVGDARSWYEQLLEVDPMNEEARAALTALFAAPTVSGDIAEAPVQSDSADRRTAVDEREVREPASDDSAGGGFSEDSLPASPIESLHSLESEFQFSSGVDSAGVTRRVSVEETTTADQTDDQMSDRGESVNAGYEHDDFDDEGSVVTETIAELYVRQGFYDRAVGIYRELIRRRGSDAKLEDRLATAERLASGEPDGETGFETEPAGASQQGAQDEADSFAESFSTGFPGGAALSSDGGRSEFAQEAEPVTGGDLSEASNGSASIGEYLRAILSWRPASSGEESGEAGLAALGAAEVLSGEPTSSDFPSGGWPQPEEHAEHDFVEGYTWADQPDVPPLADVSHAQEHVPAEAPLDLEQRLTWIEEEDPSPVDNGSDVAEGGDADSGAAGGSGLPREEEPLDDADLFPWELPPKRTEGEGGTRSADVVTSEPPVVGNTSAAGNQNFAGESRPSETFSMDTPETEESRLASTSPEHRDRPGEEDDDDLESFQAWLRSLKR